jgi:hypothetical protein
VIGLFLNPSLAAVKVLQNAFRKKFYMVLGGFLFREISEEGYGKVYKM